MVLALPEMSGSVGISPDELQRAAPIVSGFLLGYVAMLPLIGRIADLRGRVPVLIAALVVFAIGSLVTAFAYDLTSMVGGRFLQGVGGGGLVPATLALVADLYPADRRGVPLGVVSAVQEIGSVLGPLFGAVVLALADAGGSSSRSTCWWAWCSPWPSGPRHAVPARRPTDPRSPPAAGPASTGRGWASRWCCCSAPGWSSRCRHR